MSFPSTKERFEDSMVVLVALAVFLGVLVALEGQVRVRLGRHLRKGDRHAHPPGDGIDGLRPRPLEVIAFGPQRRVRFGRKLEGHPLDLDLPAPDGLLKRKLR
jgi:hypothetical protein